MRKSLAIIASALLLAVAATATHDRLRYDSTVFADSQVAGGGRGSQADYPPCVRGVREDRCIQLYERGVRRSYQRWLAVNGRGRQVADASGARSYRPCRSRNDDNCQQRVRATQTARAASPTRTTRSQQVARRAATVRRAAQARRPEARQAQVRSVRVRTPQVRTTSAAARQTVRSAPAQRLRPAARPTAPRRPGGTPGI